VVRRYEEPIEVRQGRADADGCPDAFVWRGRLYVVRAVLDHWQERRAWWRDARGAAGTRDGAAPEGGDVLTAARERRVWRVEASAGRLAGVGVYDIGAVPHDDIGAVPHDDIGAVPHDDADAGQHQWRLLRVAD
jgi:uncharacterized protein DUF6504